MTWDVYIDIGRTKTPPISLIQNLTWFQKVFTVNFLVKKTKQKNEARVVAHICDTLWNNHWNIGVSYVCLFVDLRIFILSLNIGSLYITLKK